MSDRPLLELDRVSRRFAVGGGLLARPVTRVAVRDVSLRFARGSITGIVGESGCGKSTLARLALGLVAPDGGRVLFDGQELAALAPRRLRRLRRRMAMVFQDPWSALDPRLTLRQALAEPFALQGEPVPPGRIAALLEAVGLDPALAAALPHQLSGGQRQRVCIARALALDPDLLVLDEPTASLDVSVQAQVVALLERLHRDRGLTMLFISHDIGLVRYLADRIVVMYLGAVVEVLPRPDAAPRHPYSRMLFDSTFAPDPALRRPLARAGDEPPSGARLPEGCAFASRCARAEAACRRGPPPPLVVTPEGAAYACLNPLPPDRPSPSPGHAHDPNHPDGRIRA